MDTRTSNLTRTLGGMAALLAVLLVILVAVILPRFGKAPESMLPPTQPTAQVYEIATQPESEETEASEPEETEEPEPDLPPPPENPYGPLDFQYRGLYLECLKCESRVGVDVSGYQGDIDWEQVRASGVDFAMIRLGYRGYETGKLVMDSYAVQNLEGAAAAGLPVGVYFFSQAVTIEEAVEEAEYVIAALEGYEITMPVVFDWEYISDTARTAHVGRQLLTDCAKAFLDRVKQAGYWPMMYFNVYQTKHNIFLSKLTDYDFWLAMYTNRMRFPYKIKMWQYTSKGRVPGIQGEADLNVMFFD